MSERTSPIAPPLPSSCSVLIPLHSLLPRRLNPSRTALPCPVLANSSVVSVCDMSASRGGVVYGQPHPPPHLSSASHHHNMGGHSTSHPSSFSSSVQYRPALFATSPPPSVVSPLRPAFPTSSLALRDLVTGPARLSFFRRPVRALTLALDDNTQHYNNATGTHVHITPFPSSSPSSSQPLHLTSSPSSISPAPTASDVDVSGAVSVGVQSEFRDGSSQTLPYSPDVLLDDEDSRSAEVKELLSLQSSLSFALGTLPPSLAEVEAIEAARAKAEWEAALPPLTSPANCEERQRRIAEREWKEWKAKEEQQRRDEDRRMQRLIAVMEERQLQHSKAVDAVKEERRKAAEERAERTEEKRMAEKRRAVRVLGKQRLREERRAAFMTGGLLDVSAPAMPGIPDPTSSSAPTRLKGSTSASASSASSSSALLSGLGSDVVFSAVEFGSAVYAPLARSGSVRAAKGRRAIVDFDIPALTDYDRLKAFDRKQRQQGESGDTEDLSGRPQRLLPHLPPPTRLALQQRSHLHRVDAALAEEKEQLSTSSSSSSSIHPAPGSSLNVYKSYCPIVRAPTPSLPRTAASDAALIVAVSTLQRLLRGRAEQNRNLTGQKAHAGLIAELSHGHAVLSNITTATPALLKDKHAEDEADEASEEVSAPSQLAIKSSAEGEAETMAVVLSSPSVDGEVDEFSLSSTDASPSALVDVLLGVVWSDAVLSLTGGFAQEAQLQSLQSIQSTLEFVRRVRESEESGRRQAQEEMRRDREMLQHRINNTIQHHVTAQATHQILHSAIQRWTQQQQQIKEEERRKVKEGLEEKAVEEDVDVGGVVESLLDSVLFPAVLQQAAASTAALQQRRFLVSSHWAVQRAVEEVTANANSRQDLR